ncbi:MAG: beta-ketoacyl-ACP synthase II [Alphaproteobacteria bacterium]
MTTSKPRRVVVTGMGMVSPFGAGVEHGWAQLVAGKSAVRRLTHFDPDGLTTAIGAPVPRSDRGDEGEHVFDPDTTLPKKRRRFADDFIVLAMGAARQALDDSGIPLETDQQKNRTGVIFGSGIGGMVSMYNTSVEAYQHGPRAVPPWFVPSAIINGASGLISMTWGLRGPNHAVVTACATGAHAIGDAGRLIAHGDADVMLAGGAESSVNKIVMAAFCASRTLTMEHQQTPEQASRPFDEARAGFVMGEGAGALVLEELEHARARGATIHAELLGYGLSGDAHHPTAPPADGDGAYRAMQAALDFSGLPYDRIDHINAHATSTPAGDEVEAAAIARLFGDHAPNISISATKSSIGHLIGAAGAVEAIFTIKALQDQIAPPTLNLDNPADSVAGLDLTPHKAQPRQIRAAMSNSFGFGGTNVCLVFGSV